MSNLKKNDKKIISDQEKFFDLNAGQERVIQYDTFFYDYVNKEQVDGLKWIEDCRTILDYGCSTGNSLDLFFRTRDPKKYSVYGVDISGGAIKKMQKKYPNYHFYKISNNKIPELKNGVIDGAYITHVLHHAQQYEHEQIFTEIHKKLKKGGKLLINDLSSNNPINNSARYVFVRMPKAVQDRFSDDLMVEGCIPEKYKVNVEEVTKILKKIGFKDIKVRYGHLFFFVFAWIDRFIPFSKVGFIKSIYKWIWKLEDSLLEKPFFQGKSELFYIQAIKK